MTLDEFLDQAEEVEGLVDRAQESERSGDFDTADLLWDMALGLIWEDDHA